MYTVKGKPLGLSTMRARIHEETGLGERPGKKVANCVVVFDYQEPHDKLISSY